MRPPSFFWGLSIPPTPAARVRVVTGSPRGPSRGSRKCLTSGRGPRDSAVESAGGRGGGRGGGGSGISRAGGAAYLTRFLLDRPLSGWPTRFRQNRWLLLWRGLIPRDLRRRRLGRQAHHAVPARTRRRRTSTLCQRPALGSGGPNRSRGWASGAGRSIRTPTALNTSGTSLTPFGVTILSRSEKTVRRVVSSVVA
jgi:hypothetical protein